MTRNEAAERLLEWVGFVTDMDLQTRIRDGIRAALAAERRATVERIRERLLANVGRKRPTLDTIRAILDEETAR